MADEPLSYIWVAELQQNGNIHFHILVDRFIPIKWLVKIWDQAPNSVNVKRLNDQVHAVNYMLKYMKKGNCPIEGKRYGMTQNLLDAIKPVKVRYEGADKLEAFKKIRWAMSLEIADSGGKILDFGLFIPPPQRGRKWRDKQGNIQETKGISKKISDKFLNKLDKAMKAIDFEREVDEAYKNHKSNDLPF